MILSTIALESTPEPHPNVTVVLYDIIGHSGLIYLGCCVHKKSKAADSKNPASLSLKLQLWTWLKSIKNWLAYSSILFAGRWTPLIDYSLSPAL